MFTQEPPREAQVLRTRIPAQRTVAGLDYGRRVHTPAWDGCYVRPHGAIAWALARLAPAGGAEPVDDDATIVAAIRAELEVALSSEVRAALRLLQADPTLLANGRSGRGDTLAGAMLARPVGPIRSRRAAEAAVSEAVTILDDADTPADCRRAQERGGC